MSHGAGSFRRKGNSWEYRVRMTMPDGTRKQRSFTARSQALCRQKYDEALRQIAEETVVRETLGHFARQWLEMKENLVSYRTYRNYRNYLNRYILPVLGEDRPLREIRPMDIQKMMGSVSHLSDSSRSDILLTAKQLFQCALDNELIAKDPTSRIRIRKTDEIKEIVVFTPEEVRIIQDHLPTDPIGVGIGLMLYAGLRTEEVCALRWEDIDEERNVLHICRKIIIDTGNVCKEVHSTKSRAVRYIPIPDALRELLFMAERMPHNPYVVPYRARRSYPYDYLFYTPHAFANVR